MGKTTHELAKESFELMKKYSKPAMAFTLATILQNEHDHNLISRISKIMRTQLDATPKMSNAQLQFFIDHPEMFHEEES